MRRLLALSCSIVLVDTIFFAALSPLLPELVDVGRVPPDAGAAFKAGAHYLAMTWMAGTALDPAAGQAEPRSIFR